MSLSKFTTGAAVLLALAPSAIAMGSAHVINNCGFPIYYAAVGQSNHASMQEMQGSYSQQYGQAGNGYSIKLSPSADGHVTQFEFTLGSDGKINYDLSNIDGYPFANGGMRVEPSMSGDSSNPSCVAIDCPAGAAYCNAAYNLPDDVRTHVCSDQSDIVLTMCPGGSSGTPTTGGSSASASAEAVTPAATTPAAAETSALPSGWGKPPAKRAEHGHQRVHSRAFRV